MAAGFAAALLEYAEAQGASRNGLLAASDLTGAQLADQDARIPVAAYQALVAAAIRDTGDSALLLRHTFDTQLEAMSIVGQIVHCTASLRDSITQLNRYVRLMAEVDTRAGGDRFELREGRTGVWLIDHVVPPPGQYIGLEASFARFVSEFRRSFPDQPFALALEVTYDPPPHAALYPELFGVPVRFGAQRNALQIDQVWITTDSEFTPGSRYAFGLFTRHADSLLNELTLATTTRAQVEAAILPRLHEGSLSMDALARDMGMSRQTLYRRLKDDGVTFAEIHDALRHRMALDYLGARKASVNETAYLLGFSEASSFVRAFRRWTGRSPTAHLRVLADAGGAGQVAGGDAAALD